MRPTPDNHKAYVAPRSVRSARQIIEPAISDRQIAAVHGKTLETIRRWRDRGEFETWRQLPGNRFEVPVSAYQAFIERHTLHAPTTPPHTS
jgi:hypothetical protein